MICKNNHAYEAGLYGNEEKTVCPECLADPKWWNLVDTTNGSYDYDPATGDPTSKRIDGYIELVKSVEVRCKKCDHVIKQLFRVPRKGGHRVR